VLTASLMIGGAVLGTLTVFGGAAWVDRGAETLCVRHGVPDAVRGALVLAVSSSLPELVAAVGAALWHDDPELGFASVAGSAVFNITLIPAAAALFADRVDVDRRSLRREGAFYFASLLAVGGAFGWAWLRGDDHPEVVRPWMLAPAFAVYLAYAWDKLRGGTDDDDEPDESTPIAWAKLLAGVALVTGGVELLLRFATWLGRALDTPTFVWGATAVAVATSLPDLAVSVRAARRGQSEVALTNAFGSNVFDVAVVISIAALVAGGLLVRLPVAVPLLGALAVLTVGAVVATSWRERLRGPAAAVLVALYAAYLGVTLMTSRALAAP